MRKAPVYLVLALLVLIAGQGGHELSQLESVVGPYRWGLIEWESTHFLDKWRYRIEQAIPWHTPPVAKEQVLQEFFQLSHEIEDLEKELVQLAEDETGAKPQAEEAVSLLAELGRKRSGIKSQAEERLEAEVSAILSEEGFESRLGLIWPPVDVELVTPPSVLVLSPRNVIERQKDFVLRPGLDLNDREELEDKIFLEQDLSALVVNIGGIATYPSVVAAVSGLRRAMEIAAHEWLHQYWFFRPLGRNYARDSDTTILNESAADLAAKELNRRAYAAVTGEPVEQPQEPNQTPTPAADEFDFRESMRETRLHTDDLLAAGRVKEAEDYMEERRQLFLMNGYSIRKLNQAFFAFYGTYANNPASVSPINDELKLFRATLPTVGDFIKEMSQFGSYQEFKAHLLTLEPLTTQP